MHATSTARPFDVMRGDVLAGAPGLTEAMREECRAVLDSLPPEARRYRAGAE